MSPQKDDTLPAQIERQRAIQNAARAVSLTPEDVASIRQYEYNKGFRDAFYSMIWILVGVTGSWGVTAWLLTHPAT